MMEFAWPALSHIYVVKLPLYTVNFSYFYSWTLTVCVQDVISAEFIHRLKSLLQRAYSLQEEFEGVLCMSEPSSHNTSQGESLIYSVISFPWSVIQYCATRYSGSSPSQIKWRIFYPERSWTTAVWGTVTASPPLTHSCRLLRWENSHRHVHNHKMINCLY